MPITTVIVKHTINIHIFLHPSTNTITKRRKLEKLRQPTLVRKTIPFADEVIYLKTLLDKKLNWSPQLEKNHQQSQNMRQSMDGADLLDLPNHDKTLGYVQLHRLVG